MAQVVLQDARKLYAGGIEAVRAFTLDVADGEFVVLVGPAAITIVNEMFPMMNGGK
ncbi:MAG: hypothetical protein IH985_09870 [Planctomycetes bacterium]|nr:hypothetical protein [Planctomycetota bacterium]